MHISVWIKGVGLRRSILIAIFIALFIMLSLPVSATLIVRSIIGSDEISGFRKVQDSIAINISSTTAGITINNVAASCQNQDYNYVCTLNDVQNVTTATYALKNSGGDTATATIKVDNSIGDIIISLASNSGNATLNYDITDTAFDGSAGCSGLSSIDVWWKGSETDNIEFNATPANCNYKGSRTLAITESGTGELYIKAEDKLGNSKESSKQNITIDVDAPEISGLRILEKGTENELTRIAQNTNFPVDIEFLIEDDNLSVITADVHSIHDNNAINSQYRNIAVPLSSCIINTTPGSASGSSKYYCRIYDKLLRISGSSIWINVTATDASGNKASERLEKTFEIDNERPDVVMTTSYCDSKSRCYIKDGINQIHIKLTKQNFEKKSIYFQVGNVNARVINCTAGDCYGSILLSCTGTQQARILNVAPFISQDDSGNIIKPYSTQFYCDNAPPLIKNTTWLSDAQLVHNLIMTGRTLTLIVDVLEAESEELNASAWLDKIKNATEPGRCNKYSDTKINCTWTISSITDGYYDANVIINITDTAGNLASKTDTVRVLGLMSNNETPSGLTIALNNMLPSGPINRITLSLASFNAVPYYAYAYYTIGKKSNDVQLLSQELTADKCQYEDSTGNRSSARTVFSEIKVADKFKGIGDNHRIDLTFDPSNNNANGIDDNFKIICNISAFQRVGTYVYSNPQQLVIEMPFSLKNSQLDTPGEQYVKKIRETEASLNGSGTKLIKELDKALVMLQKICNTKQFIDYAGMAGVVVQTAGIGLNALGFGSIGEPLQTKGDQTVKYIRDIRDTVWDPKSTGNIFGFLAQACDFVSCNLAFNKWGIDTVDTQTVDFLKSNVGKLPAGIGDELTDSLTSSDMKKSITMSVMKLCLPGVIYNMNKYKQMQCEYLQCLKVYSATGLDVSQCEALLSSKTCSIIVGEAFELPFIRIGKNLFSNAGDLIRNSYGYGFAAFMTWVKDSTVCKGEEADSLFLCAIPEQIKQYLSTQKKSKLAASFYYDETRDFCATAACIGPQCYSSSDLFGIPLPRYSPTSEQEAEMRLKTQFGPLHDSLHYLQTAYNSPDTTKRETALKNWNEAVNTYNRQYNADLEGIDIDLAKNAGNNFEGNSPISLYITMFDRDPSTPGNGNDPTGTNPTGTGNDPTLPPMLNPEVTYYALQAQLNELDQRLLSSEYDFGKPRQQPQTVTFDGMRQGLNPASLQPSNTNLESLLGSRVYSSVTEVPNNCNDCFYFSDNKLMRQQTQSTPLEILTVDEQGHPSDVNKVITDPKFNKVITDPKLYNALKTRVDNLKKTQEAIKQAEEEFKKAEKAYNKYRMEQQAYMLVRVFMDMLGFRKFMSAEYWAEHAGGAIGDLSRFITHVADSIDTERWSNSLCNPNSGEFYSGTDAPEGTLYQCTNQGIGCRLILTFGAEYQEYLSQNDNKTRYLYTVSYMVGPVDYNTNFNMKFKGIKGANSNGKDPLPGYNASTYLMIPQGQYLKKSKVFILDHKYSNICFLFQKDFPKIGDGMNEYCRPIKEDIFNTGRPLSDVEMNNMYGSGFSAASYSGGGFMS